MASSCNWGSNIWETGLAVSARRLSADADPVPGTVDIGLTIVDEESTLGDGLTFCVGGLSVEPVTRNDSCDWQVTGVIRVSDKNFVAPTSSIGSLGGVRIWVPPCISSVPVAGLDSVSSLSPSLMRMSATYSSSGTLGEGAEWSPITMSSAEPVSRKSIGSGELPGWRRGNEPALSVCLAGDLMDCCCLGSTPGANDLRRGEDWLLTVLGGLFDEAALVGGISSSEPSNIITPFSSL